MLGHQYPAIQTLHPLPEVPAGQEKTGTQSDTEINTTAKGCHHFELYFEDFIKSNSC